MAEHVVDFLGKSGSGIYTVTDRQIEEFIGLAKKTSKKRYRACFHDSPDNGLQNMVLCSLGASYCRPHRHLRGPEFHTIILGINLVVFFDDDGRLQSSFLASREDVVSYRIETGVWHMEIPLSPYVIDAESRRGPFDKKDNYYAAWAPSEEETEAADAFIRQILITTNHMPSKSIMGGGKPYTRYVHRSVYGLTAHRKAGDGMKVLVTGAGGFIGSFLVYALHDMGHDVTALVRREASVPVGWQGKYEVRNLAQPLYLDGCFDIVVHAAGLGRERNFTFSEYKRGNLDTMENLLAWARKGHARRIIYLSAMSIYGEIKTDNIDEQTPIVNPESYGLSKYAAERLLMEEDTVEHISLRLPGVFGRYARYPWLAKVVERCLRGDAVKIHSPEFVNNNYLYLPDLAIFIDHLMHIKWPYTELVLGMQQGVTIRDAVEIVKNATGSNSMVEITEKDERPFRINIERAESLGYTSHTFQTMIEECLCRGGWRE